MRGKTSATIGLYATTQRDGGYFHVYARPVYVGLRPSDMADIDAGRDTGPYGHHDQIRGVAGYGNDTPNGLYLDGLLVCSQGSNDDRERNLYGFAVEYRELYSVDKAKAVAMAATLTKIEKRMGALYEKYGNPATFGAYVLRVADAIGATRIVVPSNCNTQQSIARENRIGDLASGASWIDGKVRDWIQEATQNA